ncbi:hypothetical protein FNV43_RR10917 [Rhamnella rubrinervis]|uniref:Uncharacterized protein n=1 Tax=Rhamnella rubrinervis TaxID=2594499 RepID=A0A8K0H596_9ROSA|nr:hypothetical protein FNV43_RR10917 [Rhamnella rubrinervis]
MEALSSTTSEVSLSSWDYVNLLLLRPAFAIAFVLFLICLGWLLAWKLVLVHVPLVQEICGLRKKPVKPKPPTRRLSKFYNSIDTRDYASGWHQDGVWPMWSLSGMDFFKGILVKAFEQHNSPSPSSEVSFCMMITSRSVIAPLYAFAYKKKNSLDKGRANFANLCVKEKGLWKN